jgi:hypothetical protein
VLCLPSTWKSKSYAIWLGMVISENIWSRIQCYSVQTPCATPFIWLINNLVTLIHIGNMHAVLPIGMSCILICYDFEFGIHFLLSCKTKRRGRVVNTPASYLGGPRFMSWPWRPAVLIGFFNGLPQSLQVNAGIVS